MVKRRRNPLFLEMLLRNLKIWMIVVWDLMIQNLWNQKLAIKIQSRKNLLLLMHCSHLLFFSKLNLLKSDNNEISKFSTSSFDGNLIVWDIKTLLNTQKISNLSIV